MACICEGDVAIVGNEAFLEWVFGDEVDMFSGRKGEDALGMLWVAEF